MEEEHNKVEQETDQAPKEVVEQKTGPTGNDFRPDKTVAPKEDFAETKSKKRLVIAIIFVGIVAAGAATYWWFMGNDASVVQTVPGQQAQQNEEQLSTDPNTIRLLATGDWIAHDSVNSQAKTNDGYDYAKFTTAWRPLFQKTDINFCSQATPAGGEQLGVKGYPTFNAPSQWIVDMNGLGCNLINTASDHANDKGQRAISAQLDTWDEQSDVLGVAGTNRSEEKQREVRYFEVKGVKFAFVAYANAVNINNQNSYSVNLFKPALYVPQLEEASENADIVIASMRWGAPYSPTGTDEQAAIAQTLSNLGVDIIFGLGSHYTGPVNKVTSDSGRETLVWYDLGNFLNTQLETEALTGCVAAIQIDVATKAIKSNSCIPFYMHYEWTAKEAQAQDLLKRKNLQIVPLDTARELLQESRLNTTVEAQAQRITKIVNTYIDVPLIKSSEY